MKSLLLSAFTIYIVMALYAYFAQRSFLYFPTPQDFYDCPALQDFEKVVEGKTRMYVRRAGDRWVVIYHGNAGSACDRRYFLDAFSETYSFVIPEYTGYSNDTDSPTEQALLKNVEDAAEYVRKQNPREVTVVGESIGTALAAYHNRVERAGRMILIAAFSNLPDVARRHYWFLPVSLLLKDTYPSERWIQQSDSVLVLHGTDDEIIPIDLGRKLFERIEGKNKLFVAIEGAGHNDIYDSAELYAAIRDFMKSTTAKLADAV